MEALFSPNASVNFVLMNLNRAVLRPEYFPCCFRDYFLRESLAKAGDKCSFAALEPRLYAGMCSQALLNFWTWYS